MNIRIFCRCSFFPFLSVKELISPPVNKYIYIYMYIYISILSTLDLDLHNALFRKVCVYHFDVLKFFSSVLFYFHIIYIYIYTHTYRSADKPLARCILFDGDINSFDASLEIYIYTYIYIYQD